ncbi:MAG TPA: 5'-nucleotidase C-terminal domain-containing protein [Candidatus Deferrimicrobium sp.]|nr:5'-nucleotidase C-terminal domain-containing protein [Candidatus Deferrimicrobium sp.]
MKKRLSVLLSVILILGLVFTSFPFKVAIAATTVKITLLETSDVHGVIYPYDYFKDAPANGGFAKLSTLVKGVRADNPNTLLLDNGDNQQGTPLTYYFNKVDTTGPNPVIAAMNIMGYDAMTLGNHEFNYGLSIVDKARSESKFPWLSANIYKEDGTNYFTPYIVKTVAGVKVGILGLTTKNIPNWEVPANIKGLVFKDTVEEAQKWVKILKDTEKVDLVVLLAHEGFEKDIDTGKDLGTSIENQAYAIATTVPGIDVMLTGHTHLSIPGKTLNGVLVMQPKNAGVEICKADITMEQTATGWKVATKTGTNLPVTADTVADQVILDATKTQHETAVSYMKQPIGEATGDFPGATSRTEDSAIMDLIQKVQMKYANTDLSLAAMLPDPAPSFKKGPLTVRDMYSLYIYENTLFAITVTGQQIKDELEWSAKYFNTYTYNKTATTLVNSSVVGYNYDMLQGADYVIDTTKPVGQRISGLIYHGKPMDMTATYTLALNNYRAGGGGFLGFKGSPIVYQSSDEIRNLMIQYVKDTGKIDATVDNNWHLVPDYLNSQYRAAIDTLNRQSALSEFPTGAFVPDSTATRGDLAAIITGSYTAMDSRNHASSFVDVASNAWYARSIGTVQARKLMNGTSARTFAPDAPATTEQAVTALIRASGYGNDASKYDLCAQPLDKVPNLFRNTDGTWKWEALAADTKKNNGATINMRSGQSLGGVEMYAITLPVVPGMVVNGYPTGGDLKTFTMKNAKWLLDRTGYALGTWYNKGKTYIDVSTTIPWRDYAVTLGKEYDQISIFDLANFEEIPTGGTSGKSGRKPNMNLIISDWALPYVAFAESKGFITAEQATAPKHQLTRGELADMVVKMRFPAVVILQTNDFHGNLVPAIDANKNSVAGAAREATIINSLRSTFGKDHVLLVDAGDAIQGATIANMFQGKNVIEVYNAMGYDVATLGNHEWDYGQQVLKDRISEAKFDYVNANVTGVNLGWKSNVIKNVAGINIGLFGVITSDLPTIVAPSSLTGVGVADPIATAQNQIVDLKGQGAQYIVALSHCGYENGGAPLDPAIAAGAPGINLIIGGHSHTVLKVEVMVGKTMITQTGTAGAYVGKEVIDFTTYQGKIIRQNVSYELVPTVTSVPEDPPIKAIVDGYNNQLKSKLSVVVGKALVALDGERADVRTKETNLGNYVTDWMCISTGADIAFEDGGSIRVSVPAGDVTVGSIYDVLPFDNFLEVLEIKGSTLKAALENSVSAYPAQAGAFAQVSGFSFTFDPSKPVGSRVVSITRDGKPMDMDATYKLCVQDYTALGGDGYAMLTGEKIVYKSSEWNRDGLVNYIKANPEINPTVEGRITVVTP